MTALRVANLVFSDTAGSATNRTTASTPGHSTLSVSVTEFSAVWAYTPVRICAKIS